MSQWSNQVPKESSGFIPVSLQDQHSEMIVAPLHVLINDGLLLLAATVVDTSTVSLVPGHLATSGKLLCLKEGTHFYIGVIKSMGGDVATMDTPLDHAYTTAAIVCVGDPNLNKAGTPAAPVVAHLSPSPGADWDITRLHVSLTDATVMDSEKFGGIAALTDGVVLRAANGTTKNIANVKTNNDLALVSSDYKYDDKAPAGVFRFSSNHVFGGQSHVGVTIRLIGADADELQAIIQDDLTALTGFKIVAVGHVVAD